MGQAVVQSAHVPARNMLDSHLQSRHFPPNPYETSVASLTITSANFPGKIHFHARNTAWKIPASVGNDKQGAVMETILQP